MSTEWYWAQDGEQHGPLAEEELRKRFVVGDLPKETLVWSDGMSDWAPASRVAALTAPMAPPPPPPSRGVPNAEPAVATAGAGAQGPSVRAATSDSSQAARRAWARFAARSIDLALPLLAALLFGLWPSEEDYVGRMLMSVGGMAVWIFLEPLFLMRSGMTPGKWLFRVRVVHADGRFLSYLEGLKRGAQAVVMGLGAGFPVLSLVMPALAFRDYTVNGSTPWDRSGRFEVQHGQIGTPQKAVLAVLLMVLVLSLLAQPTAG